MQTNRVEAQLMNVLGKQLSPEQREKMCHAGVVARLFRKGNKRVAKAMYQAVMEEAELATIEPDKL